jgi:hypothetical protein
LYQETIINKALMKNTSTIDIDLIISKSLFLRRLLLSLPDHELRKILVSPREEFIQSLKWHLQSPEKREDS